MIKQRANQGGRSFEKYIIERQVESEMRQMRQAYSSDISKETEAHNSFVHY